MPRLGSNHIDSGSVILHVDVAVVGAGFAGLYLLHRLRKAGFSTVGLEAADDVGGTWYWNRYPGARCDIQTIDYAYTFDPELDKAWTWSEKYATQSEILRYLSFVADRYDLRRDIHFGTSVASAQWNEGSQRWLLTTDRGCLHFVPPLHHGDGLSLCAKTAGNRRGELVRGPGADDRPLATQRRRPQRQARRGDRHRVLGDPAHSDRRRTGRLSSRSSSAPRISPCPPRMGRPRRTAARSSKATRPPIAMRPDGR